ncbi:hypothetical protein [Streptomyces sp. NPDC008125]
MLPAICCPIADLLGVSLGTLHNVPDLKDLRRLCVLTQLESDVQ